MLEDSVIQQCRQLRGSERCRDSRSHELHSASSVVARMHSGRIIFQALTMTHAVSTLTCLSKRISCWETTSSIKEARTDRGSLALSSSPSELTQVKVLVGESPVALQHELLCY